MNILFVARMLPHPRFRGSGGQDLLHYIEALGEKHAVSLIAFATSDQGEAIRQMQRVCERVIAVPYDHHSLLARVTRALWRVLFPKVYGRNVSMTYARALRALAAEQNYDVFVVEGTMALYSWLLREDKLVIDEIDIYSRMAFQEYELERNSIRRLFTWFEWKRTRMFEFMALRKSAGVMVRSRSDRDWLVHQSVGIEISVISPWFEGLSELLSIEPRRPDGSKILFMGALKNPKNSAAVQFFVSKIFPLIKNAVPGAIFFVVGDAPPPVIREFGHDSSIIVTGEVESLKSYYEQAAVVVVPLLVGGGIIVKTLNGMAAGRPTVSTAPGVSGIDARPDQDLIVVPTDPIMFAEAVIRVLTDGELWSSLAKQGKDFVGEQFQWSEAMVELERFLVQAAGEQKE